MTETTVVTSGEGEDPSVLAEAAVAAAAVAGASAERASEAKDDAEVAGGKADLALHVAGNAEVEAASKVDEETARRIAREEAEAALVALLAKAKADVEPAPPTPAEGEVNPQVLPPSVEKANETKRDGRSKWARAWEGGE